MKIKKLLSIVLVVTVACLVVFTFITITSQPTKASGGGLRTVPCCDGDCGYTKDCVDGGSICTTTCNAGGWG